MDSAIWVALISGLCVAIPTLITTIVSNNKSKVLVEYKITELTKKVEKHNSVIERTFLLEQRVENDEEKLQKLENQVTHIEDDIYDISRGD
jgi:hypothetical protein